MPNPHISIPRNIFTANILPILIISDSIMKNLNPISGVEILSIPGLSASTLMFNLMQHTFISWLKLQERQAVIVHVGTNDLFFGDLTAVKFWIIHSLYILISAGPFVVYSSILPRVRDYLISDHLRRTVNDSVCNYFKDQNMYVPVWRTYRDFLHSDSPKNHLYNHFYERSGAEDNIHLNLHGQTVLRNFLCRKVAILVCQRNINRPNYGTVNIIRRFDLPINPQIRSSFTAICEK